MPATIHLDLDGDVHIFRAHGWRYTALDGRFFASGLNRALDLFDETGVCATLFVIAEDIADPAKRALLKEAVRRGHAIGSHTVTHRNLTTLRRDEKHYEIFESRERLMDGLGVEVQGFRAPGFALDRESLEMIAEAGYTYDSSLFPNARSALRVETTNVPARPHRPLANATLVELPMPSHWPLPLPFHPSYSLVLGLWYFRLGLGLVQRTSAPLVLLFHLTDFAEPLPESVIPNIPARLYTLSHLDSDVKAQRSRQMLQMVASRFQILSTRQLLDHATD